jgi:hypothetical protein
MIAVEGSPQEKLRELFQLDDIAVLWLIAQLNLAKNMPRGMLDDMSELAMCAPERMPNHVVIPTLNHLLMKREERLGSESS